MPTSAPPVNSATASSAAALARIGRPKVTSAPAPITITLRLVSVMLLYSSSGPAPRRGGGQYFRVDRYATTSSTCCAVRIVLPTKSSLGRV